MKKNFPVLLITWLLLYFNSLAQDGCILKFEYLPEARYNMSTSIQTDGETNFSGNEQIEKYCKSQNIAMPLKTNITQTIEAKVITGPLTDDSSFSFKTIYEKFHTKHYMNGEMKQDAENPLSGLTFSGTYKNNTISDAHFEGENLSDEIKSSLDAVIEGMLKKIQFPPEYIKIGDTFKREFPMQIPVPGMGPIELTMVMTYKLNSVNNDLAYLDIITEAVMTSKDSSYSLTSNGTGSGTLIHNIKKNIFTEMKLDMDMFLEITASSIKITSKNKTKTISTVTF